MAVYDAGRNVGRIMGCIGGTCLCVCGDRARACRGERRYPNFAPDNMIGWLKLIPGDEFIAPASGPGPIKSDPARPYISMPSRGRKLQDCRT